MEGFIVVAVKVDLGCGPVCLLTKTGCGLGTLATNGALTLNPEAGLEGVTCTLNPEAGLEGVTFKSGRIAPPEFDNPDPFNLFMDPGRL